MYIWGQENGLPVGDTINIAVATIEHRALVPFDMILDWLLVTNHHYHF